MANYKVVWQLQVTDVDGNIAQVEYTGYPADTVLISGLFSESTAFNTAVAAATNGKVTRASASILFLEAQLIPGTPPPTDAVYPTVTDGARINFSNSEGKNGHVTIPAPTETTFLPAPQRNYVDPAGDASGLITLLQTNYQSSPSTPLNLYQGGVKVGRGARKRRPPKAGLS